MKLRSAALVAIASFSICGCGVSGGPSLLSLAPVVPSPAPSPTPSPTPLPLNFTAFQTSGVIIGQASPTTNGAANGAAQMSGPTGNPIVISSKLFIPDTGNTRIQTFNSVPVASGAAADLSIPVVGNGGTIPNGAHQPRSLVLSAAASFFAISNAGDDNIGFLGWNAVPSAPGPADFYQAADSASCARAHTSFDPRDLVIAGGKMILADSGCNRVLIYNTVPTASNTPADVVLGQMDYVSGMAGTGAFSAVSAYMDHPAGVWSDGTKLFVSDSGNHRVLVWNTFPASNVAPDFALGQADFTAHAATTTASGLSSPSYMTVLNKQLFLCDTGNNRVLIWNTLPATFGAAATRVLGQGNFTLGAVNDDAQIGAVGAGPTARTMNGPSGIYVTTSQVFVSDTANNRVLVFNAGP